MSGKLVVVCIIGVSIMAASCATNPHVDSGSLAVENKDMRAVMVFPSGDREKISQIYNLTPGDFKVVRDRYSFYPAEDIDHSMLIEVLQEEAEIKALHHLKKKVGF